MKKICIVILVLLSSVFAYAAPGFFGSFGGASKTDATPESVLHDCNSVVDSVSKSNELLLKSYTGFEQAIGNEDKASQLSATQELLYNDPKNVDINKKASDQLMDVANDLKATDLNTTINLAKSQPVVLLSLTYMLAAISEESVAAKKSTDVMSSMKSIFSNPMNATNPDVLKLRTAMPAVQYVSSVIPGQIASGQAVIEKVSKYIKDNNIAAPTSDEIATVTAKSFSE